MMLSNTFLPSIKKIHRELNLFSDLSCFDFQALIFPVEGDAFQCFDCVKTEASMW